MINNYFPPVYTLFFTLTFATAGKQQIPHLQYGIIIIITESCFVAGFFFLIVIFTFSIFSFVDWALYITTVIARRRYTWFIQIQFIQFV